MNSSNIPWLVLAVGAITKSRSWPKPPDLLISPVTFLRRSGHQFHVIHLISSNNSTKRRQGKQSSFLARDNLFSHYQWLIILEVYHCRSVSRYRRGQLPASPRIQPRKVPLRDLDQRHLNDTRHWSCYLPSWKKYRAATERLLAMAIVRLLWKSPARIHLQSSPRADQLRRQTHPHLHRPQQHPPAWRHLLPRRPGARTSLNSQP